MSGFVRVVVNASSLGSVSIGAGPRTFDYGLPEALRGVVGPGHLLVVPFGARTVQAVVLNVLDQPAVQKTKDVLELADPAPVMTPAQISLAEWLAGATLTSIPSVLGLFLPPGLNRAGDIVFSLRSLPAGSNRDEDAEGGATSPSGSRRGPVGSRLLRLLAERGPLRGRQIDRALPRVEWRRTAQYLVRGGFLEAHSILPPASVRPKFIRTAQLAVAPAVADEQASNLGSTAATQMRREKALRYLMQRPEALNVAWVYAESGCGLADLQELAERDLIVLREQEIWRDPLSGDPRSRPGSAATTPVILTAEQSAVWRAIEVALQTKEAGAPVQSLLVEGVTGSGKTELYVRAAAEAVRMGKQVIMMVPEIALTPQTIDRFLARFPGQVGLIHSGLSDGERYDTWRRARAGALQVIIGPRSALFAPLPSIGLVVVDECHDGSYYQSEPPFYDAVTAAQAYARYCGAVCIMGSATPSVVQRYDAQTGGSIRLALSQRVASASEEKPAPIIGLPPVRIVDMREELKTGNRSSFSRDLQESLAGVLEQGEQAILFLNRRGTATYVFCRNCGYVVRCPRCDSPLTYHTPGAGRLLCHRCGYARQLPKTCPQCGAADIRAYGLGTESVEAEVQRTWPRARTLRWDWETTRQKQAHEMILSHFARRKADVLIGTQMLAKGLDLPGVTLVGIVLADVGLFLPDPFASERTFQLLTQVAGRAGRSTLGGKVILQTFAPTHHVIQAAARHDVAGFYEDELAQRRRLGYPPFSRLLRLEFRHYDPVRAQDEAQKGAAFLQARLPAQGDQRLAMIGPAPCFYSRLDGKYRWQIVLRGSGFQSFIDERRFKDWRIEADPISLL